MTRPRGAKGELVDASIDHAVVDAVLLELTRLSSGHDGRCRSTNWPGTRESLPALAERAALGGLAVMTELGENPSPSAGSLRRDLVAAVRTLLAGSQRVLGPPWPAPGREDGR